MPSSALATVQLETRAKRNGVHVRLRVWNRSFDDPDEERRSTRISAVYLCDLPQQPGYNVTNTHIRDRSGVDQISLWRSIGGQNEFGFEGYQEWDVAGECGPDLPNVFWSALSGIYDERCLCHPACDARRLQSFSPDAISSVIYQYLVSPVTFEFDVNLKQAPRCVRLEITSIGGNGGDPAVRGGTNAIESFVVSFPTAP